MIRVALGIVTVLVLVGVSRLTWDGSPVLDDNDQIAFLAAQGDDPTIFGPDCYGLFRPAKNLIFAVANDPEPVSGGVRGAWVRMASLLGLLLALPAAATLGGRLFGDSKWGLCVMAVWALAPTQVSTLAFMSCSNIAWCGALAFWAWVLHELGASKPVGMGIVLRLMSGTLLFGALLCYEAAIALPLVLVVWDLSRGRVRIWSETAGKLDLAGLFRRSARWIPVGLASVAFLVFRNLLGMDLSVGNQCFGPMSDGVVTASSGWFLLHHLWLWLWPFGGQFLMGSYAMESATLFWGRVVLSWGCLGILSWGAWRLRKEAPAVGIGLLVYLAWFFPVSNLVPLRNGPYADYYLVLPSIGLAMAFVGVLQAVSVRLSRPWRGSVLAGLAGLRVAVMVTMIPWALAWGDELRLFLKSAESRPGDPAIEAHLARLALGVGALDEASERANRAAERAPWFRQAQFVRMSVAYQRGDAKAAMTAVDVVRASDPAHPYPWLIEGYVAMDLLDDSARAKAALEEALRRRWTENSRGAGERLANLALAESNRTAAAAVIERMRELDPEPCYWNEWLDR